MYGASKRVSQAVSGAAPVKGINDVDPLANMGPEFCIHMVDVFPNSTSVDLRAGYQDHVVGIENGGSALSLGRLMTYVAMDGTKELFATTSAGVFDVTTATDPDYLPAPDNVYAITNGVVNYTQLTNTGGTYLICANGVDDAFFYDGSTFAPFVADATPVNPGEINGLDPALITFPLVYRNRVWVVQKDSLSAWYFPTDAIAGDLTEFPLGGVFNKGGHLVEITTWSMDTGAGMDDMLVFRSSVGEVAIYTGENPNDATTWQLVSVYFVSEPVGKVRSIDLGGDSVMLCRSGLMPLSKIVQGAAGEDLFEAALSRNISGTLNRLIVARNDGTQSEWEIHNVSDLQMMFVVVPNGFDGNPIQYVMNTSSGAWTSFKLPATCMAVMGGKLYFGTADGRVCVYTSWSNITKDGVHLDGTGGGPVVGQFMTAFSYLGDPTTLKHFKLVRPTTQALTLPDTRLSIAVDFDTSSGAVYGTPSLASAETSDWDSALWDDAVWANSNTVFRPWSGVVGYGYAAAVRFKLANISKTSVAALEVVYEVGGLV